MPSRHKSSACTDYVPAICTHRPSLLLIGCRVEIGGFRLIGGNLFELVETYQYSAARRSKSRNKVAVGEPAAGSLPKSVLLRQTDTSWSQSFIVPCLLYTSDAADE